MHEPDAEELKIGVVLQDRFDQGREVGRLARERFPGGLLIPPGDRAARIEATNAALAGNPPAVFEAAFAADDVFVAVDVLLKDGDGWAVIEVKSSTSVKDEHVLDCALQVHVLRRAGLVVTRTEVMHLNTDFRHPDQGELFQRDDVTSLLDPLLALIPNMITAQLEALNGPLPDVPIGLHCFEPRDCPFHDRCWPDDPLHIARLYNNGPKKTSAYLLQGIHSVTQIPPTQRLPDAAKRQLRALEQNAIIVEPGLAGALTALDADRLGFLDFETVNRAIPVWDGLGPWRPAVVQFSYHEQESADTFSHRAYLAEGPHDPRPEMVERMLETTAKADRIVMYSSYERTRINELATQLPAWADDLHALSDKLVDLLPIVRNNVYHPGFMGSFSLKAILNPLVPDLTYRDLAIVDGQVASVEIARLLFVAHLVKDRDQLRSDLLAYCERDTWAMVRLWQRLAELARGSG